MKGTRPLDNDEIRLVSACFTGTFEVRNRGLFMLGVSTGGRISELISLTSRGCLPEGKAGHSPHNAPIDRRNDLIFFCGYDIL